MDEGRQVVSRSWKRQGNTLSSLQRGYAVLCHLCFSQVKSISDSDLHN
jgi:hypothetical protein